jgi:hypothetical protein
MLFLLTLWFKIFNRITPNLGIKKIVKTIEALPNKTLTLQNDINHAGVAEFITNRSVVKATW